MADPQQLSAALHSQLDLNERQEFKEFMSAIQPIADDDAVSNQIAKAMQARHNSPPAHDLQTCLGKPISEEQARQLLFYPGPQEMAQYPTLLKAPQSTESLDDASRQKCLNFALTSLYLVHARRWDRVKPFIEAGGLMQLKDLLSHSNLYIASQAMQCFQLFTDEEMYPWHDPPTSQDGKGLAPEDARLWQQMFQATQSGLIPGLLRHLETFPGSGLLALTIFAWVVSWLRFNFTKERVLRLSPNLLGLLKEWSTRQSASEEERKLAKQLHEDFGRAGPAGNPSTPQLGNSAEDTSMPEDTCVVHITKDHTQVNSYKPSDAERLKQLGNEAYRETNYSKAISCYSRALDVPVPSSELLGEGQRRAVMLSNRAAAYLGRAEAGGGAEGTCDDEGILEGLDLGTPDAVTKHYEAALIDAQAGIDLDPTYAKAHQRKIQALSKLGRLQEALKAGEHAPSTASSGKEFQELLRRIRDSIDKAHTQGGGEQGAGQQDGQGQEGGGAPKITVISETQF